MNRSTGILEGDEEVGRLAMVPARMNHEALGWPALATGGLPNSKQLLQKFCSMCKIFDSSLAAVSGRYGSSQLNWSGVSKLVHSCFTRPNTRVALVVFLVPVDHGKPGRPTRRLRERYREWGKWDKICKFNQPLEFAQLARVRLSPATLSISSFLTLRLDMIWTASSELISKSEFFGRELWNKLTR